MGTYWEDLWKHKFSFDEVKSKLLRITLPCFFLMQHNPPNICEL